jgi:hypothetical protein
MFGLTLGKLVFTILVVIAIWKAFAYVGRLAQERQQAEALRKRAARASHRPPRASGKRTIDLVACPRCGAYVDPEEGCQCARTRA